MCSGDLWEEVQGEDDGLALAVPFVDLFVHGCVKVEVTLSQCWWVFVGDEVGGDEDWDSFADVDEPFDVFVRGVDQSADGGFIESVRGELGDASGDESVKVPAGGFENAGVMGGDIGWERETLGLIDGCLIGEEGLERILCGVDEECYFVLGGRLAGDDALAQHLDAVY